MKTRIAILMAFVMALAIVGALYATNRTAEAGEIRQIDVQAGTAVSLVISADSPTCSAGNVQLDTTRFRRVDLGRGLTYANGTLTVPTYPTYPRSVWFGYIVYGRAGVDPIGNASRLPISQTNQRRFRLPRL